MLPPERGPFLWENHVRRFRETLPPMLAVASLLAGCGGDAPEDGEDGLTAAEERQLDDAAERLDAEREAYEAEIAAQARDDAAAAVEAGAESDGAGETP